MRRLAGLLVILSLLFAWSCRKDKDDVSPALREYIVFVGQQIQTIYDTLPNNIVVTRYEMVPGDKLVFKAVYIAPQSDEIFDDDYSETLWFEVDSALTEFYFEEEGLEGTKAYFVMSGAWVPNKPFEVREGSIEGRKISREYWEVWVDMKAETTNDYRIKISLHDLFKVLSP